MTTVQLPYLFLTEHGTRIRRVVTGAVAVSLSLALHTGLPALDLGSAKKAKSNIALQIVAAPPLPVADLPQDGPLDDPEPPPAADDEELAAVDDEELAAVDEAIDEASPEAIDDEALAAVKPPAVPVVPSVDEAAVKARERQLADRIAARKARIAELRRIAEERRRGRRAAQAGSGAGGAAAPMSGPAEVGDPDAVHLCEAGALGREVQVHAERPLTSWVAVIPTALMGFDTRPGIGDFLGDTMQVLQRERRPRARLGIVEFALPAEVLQFELDQPRGVRVALGRGDGRCLVGLRYTPQLFPLTLKRVPMRLVDAQNRTVDALVDIEFFKDASFAVKSLDGTDLPFTQGRVKNARHIASNIEDHYQAARLAKAVAGFFGIDLKKAVQGGNRPAPTVTPGATAERARGLARGGRGPAAR